MSLTHSAPSTRHPKQPQPHVQTLAQPNAACISLGPLAPGMGHTLGRLLKQALECLPDAGKHAAEAKTGPCAAPAAPAGARAGAVRATVVVAPQHSARLRDAERLDLTVHSQAGSTPPQALAAAAKRLQDMLADAAYTSESVATRHPPITTYPPHGYESAQRQTEAAWLISQPVAVLGLSPKVRNALQAEGLQHLHALVQRNAQDLLGVPHLGRKGLAEVQAALAAVGLTLAPPARRR